MIWRLWSKELLVFLVYFGARVVLSQNDGDDNELGLSAAPPADMFLRRLGMAATIVGDFVYIDGGQVSQRNSDGEIDSVVYRAHAPNRTLSIDMSESWNPREVSIRELQKSLPDRYDHAIFRQDSNFFIWGGHRPRGRDIGPPELWEFVPNHQGGGQWHPEEPANNEEFSNLKRSEAGAAVSLPDAGFYFGGLTSRLTDTESDVEHLVSGYVVVNYTTNTWTNETHAPWNPTGTLWRGSAEYIPSFGPNGLIMFLGGGSGSTSRGSVLMDLGNLTLLDPVTKEWYSQGTTGDDLPPRRRAHCTVGAEGPNGTHEIFLYGGWDQLNDEEYDDVYVLSLPGFVWMKADYPARNPRREMKCLRVGNRQMLSIGGSFGGDDVKFHNTDNFPQGLGIFDLTEMQWKDEYDADADEYESPDRVRRWYEDGGLDTVEWSPGVEALFIKKDDPNDSTDSNDSNDSNNPSGPSDPSDPKDPEGPDEADDGNGVNVGMVVGSVVGGVAGLVLFAVLGWFFIIRPRRRDAPQRFGVQEAASSPRYELAQDTRMAEIDGSTSTTPLKMDQAPSPYPPYPPYSPYKSISELDSTGSSTPGLAR